MTDLEKELQAQVDYYKHEYFSECELREKLEKALDKACDLLNRAQELDCAIFDGILPNDVPDLRNEENWKEWLMKND